MKKQEKASVKLRFTSLPIYKAIRGSKLSKRTQDEVLRKLKALRDEFYGHYGSSNAVKCSIDLYNKLDLLYPWKLTKEGPDYWWKMHKDSGL
jgi:hypothetical protein